MIEAVTQVNRAGRTPWTLDRAGHRIPGHEAENRLDAIAAGLAVVDGVGFHTADAANSEVEAVLAEIHSSDYLEFLELVSRELPEGEHYVASDRSAPGVAADTPVTRGTYTLACEAVRVALSAAGRVAVGSAVAYALCRPPGHHAGPSWAGGYCYLNNAAAAAFALVRAGAERVGVLDLDFHLGNGTAAICAEHAKVAFGSVHMDPRAVFPWQNLEPGEAPLISFERSPSSVEFLDAVRNVRARLLTEGAAALVVSIGFDIVDTDPHGGWALPATTFRELGALLRSTGVPLCLVQEGGYNLGTLPQCATHLARGLTSTPT